MELTLLHLYFIFLPTQNSIKCIQRFPGGLLLRHWSDQGLLSFSKSAASCDLQSYSRCACTLLSFCRFVCALLSMQIKDNVKYGEIMKSLQDAASQDVLQQLLLLIPNASLELHVCMQCVFKGPGLLDSRNTIHGFPATTWKFLGIINKTAASQSILYPLNTELLTSVRRL